MLEHIFVSVAYNWEEIVISLYFIGLDMNYNQQIPYMG